MDRSSRCPVAVAVPLHDVDFAAVDRAVVGHVPGGPTTRGEAVQLHPGFPGVADAAPPLPEELAAVVGVAVLGSAEDKVGLAVEEHVSTIVSVLADVLG